MRKRLPPIAISVRVLAALALVFGGYVALHTRFATFDADLVRFALGRLGFDVDSTSADGLSVQAGSTFNLYAVVTGSCSSAAGVLGIAAVAFVLLPGRLWRRVLGGLVAALVFVACNVARICSIVVLGWWMASADRTVLLVSFVVPAVVCLFFLVRPRTRVLLRAAALLVGGLCGVLAFDVWQRHDYLAGMASYHALAGPMLTFGALAGGIVLLWKILVGREHAPAAPAA